MVKCAYCELANEKFENTGLIYEDEDFKAIFIPQTSLGHAIILPKKHYVLSTQIPEFVTEKMYSIIPDLLKKISPIIKTDSFTIISNSGCDQFVAHYSLHVVPRVENDGLNFIWKKRIITKSALDVVKSQLTQGSLSAPSSKEVRQKYFQGR